MYFKKCGVSEIAVKLTNIWWFLEEFNITSQAKYKYKYDLCRNRTSCFIGIC